MENLTLEQWRERALVAEALLEERTQECEGLRAKLDQADIEKDAKREKYRQAYGGNGGKWEIYKGEVDEQKLDEARQKMLRQMGEFLRGDVWSVEDIRRAGLMDPTELRKIMEEPPKFEITPKDPRKGHEPPDYMRRHAPRQEITEVTARLDNDKDTIEIRYKFGGASYGITLSRRAFDSLRGRMSDAQIANTVVRNACNGGEVSLPQRAQGELATRLMDAFRKLDNGRGPDRGIY